MSTTTVPETRTPGTASSPEVEQSVGRLATTARQLAREHGALAPRAPNLHLLRHLRQQEETLEQAHAFLAATTDEELAHAPASEWILDNFYMIRQALRLLEEDLPAGYYQTLPHLAAAGIYAGYPRIYAVAREAVLYEKCQLTISRLERFIEAYQKEVSLTMGEVWAFPLMLRFSILETVAQVVNRLTQVAAPGEHEPALRFQLDQIDDGTVVANCVSSLRLLGTQDWQDFFEHVSLVEATLRRDPAGVYGQMDFATRDRYRKEVETLSRHCDDDEPTVALAVVDQARLHGPEGDDGRPREPQERGGTLFGPRKAHVGYFLLDRRGRRTIEGMLGCRLSPLERFNRWASEHPFLVYFGSAALLTIGIVAALVVYAVSAGATMASLALIVLLSLIPASVAALSLVNWAVTGLTSPKPLPKIDFDEGVSLSCRTMVVIPALISSPESIDSLLQQLELHYLRNSDPALGFALLTDFADSDTPVHEEDEPLLAHAISGLEALNKVYPQRPFYLFHRKRLWNPLEGKWMGWERKRGKLHEFNQLLRGQAQATSFIVQEGDPGSLDGVRYVITLDADTVLPREGANRLIGALAHPLNQAVFDPAQARVVDGYAILQPRTEIIPAGAVHSLFSRVFGGDVGLDLYSHAVSDVYQDLFGEGTYFGKGIYDVDAFERSLTGRVPENRLLSHDLFEGMFARAGLASDIILYEQQPSHYLVHILRSQRWIRGDWQLLPWLFPLTSADDSGPSHDLPVLGLWKIADNLRRSLLAPALFTLLLAGWAILPGSPFFWTAVAFAILAVPLLTPVVTSVLQDLSRATWRAFLRTFRDNAIRWLLQIVFLPFETILVLNAVGTTLWRLFVSRRHLLQWTTAADTEQSVGQLSIADVLRIMLPSALLSLGMLALVALLQPAALVIAAPVVFLWWMAGPIAHWVSQPKQSRPRPLPAQRVRELRRLARRTWLFYDRQVGPLDHWLPPDNFQAWPRAAVARRTSPTNVGLYLLSVVAASDLGYISPMHMAVRLMSAFQTLDLLDRYRGHFLNWIDTDTLRPLYPRYVSTVDSGNLAASLVVLRQACLEARQQPIWRRQRWEGLLDTIGLVMEMLEARDSADIAAVRQALEQMRDKVEAQRSHPESWVDLVATLVETDLLGLEQALVSLLGEDIEQGDWLHDWRVSVEALQQNVHGIHRQLETFAPWMRLLQRAPDFLQSPVLLPGSLREDFEQLVQALRQYPTVEKVPPLLDEAVLLADRLSAFLASWPDRRAKDGLSWCRELSVTLRLARMSTTTLLDDLAALADRAAAYVEEMDFSFLFNERRQVFHIGYNLEHDRLDDSYYDLLASEARITSVIAIAKGDVPASHWLHLSRPLIQVEGGLALLSWSGTMFEYFMPPLILKTYRGTLIERSLNAVVDEQIHYASERGVPWGISESGFYAFDSALNYQYRAFGVPSLGYKRGLGDDLVIAPYASMLALDLRPQEVVANIDRLRELGAMGLYGLHEAVDYTPARASPDGHASIVQSYMAHHQGMIMLSLLNYLQDDRMVSRFHADPRIQSVELLLQEQIPTNPQLEKPRIESRYDPPIVAKAINADPWAIPVASAMPQLHLLSNGRFNSFITNAGGGYCARGQDYLYTRWRADTTQDDWGSWLYVQDLDNDLLWSACLQPIGRLPDTAEVQFYPHMAVFYRRDHNIALQMEVVVAPDEDVEVRRVSVINDSDETRRLRLTSYSEVALAEGGADRRHQAFAKLFVESEYVAEVNALFFRRRPRSHNEEPRYLAHMLVTHGDVSVTGAYESNRMAFLGRTNTARLPEALTRPSWLSGSAGATLDPVMSLGQEVTLEPRTSVEIALITFTAETHQELMGLARRYRRWSVIERTPEQARSAVLRDLRSLDMPVEKVALAHRLLSLLFYPHHSLRANRDILAANNRGQTALWPYGVSGDYPILLLLMEDESSAELLQEVLRAHMYWRRRGLQIDLVILNEKDSSYEQPLQALIGRIINRMDSQNWLNQRGGIFILRRDQLPEQDVVLLNTVARVILNGAAGSFEEQVGRLGDLPPPLPDLVRTQNPADIDEATPPLPLPQNLQFDNGYGGFSADGKEYVITVHPAAPTPLPWINVIANEHAGFLISEAGGGYSWAVNSGENRLTTWRNDPVTDMPSEALYLRDEVTAEVWSPLPQPAPAEAPYVVRHGAGYTLFEHHSHRLKQEVRLFMAADDPVKVVQVRLENTSTQPRRLTLTLYAEWVLGSTREDTVPYIVPAYRPDIDALLARNPYSLEFGERVAFVAASKRPHGLTTDRTEFLGRLGSLSQPAALQRIGLSDRVEPGLDPCAAIQVHIDLAPGEHENLFYLIGQGQDKAAAVALIEKYRQLDAVNDAWRVSTEAWEQILTAVQVETPDRAMDLLLNRWLLYQALSCRIWGRSALYQSSGAYGFRDQLQDVMALVHTRPDLARAHLLRAARHQFEGGDVLHWWHPPAGRGVRTRISDDLVWLPYVAAHYIKVTGDAAVLSETAPFLVGPPLAPDEEERYGHFDSTEQSYSLYEHCLRALRHASTQGPHGLPLIGSGDWNDGMNRVGIEDRGESVWLAWFLYDTLFAFARLCEVREDPVKAAELRSTAEQYREAAERNAWDGAWYRRAYYDSGLPLGSQQNMECKIDALAQSWAVLSGAADPERARKAMDSVSKLLVEPASRLLLLFTPPFDRTDQDPGYIKGYLPGVRENGGQYTHAALWSIWAYATLGDGDQAGRLFRMINPIYHANARAKADVYKVEPYVVAADVYNLVSHRGRGGWTWYTGSSGWMYRLGIEGLLGLQREGDAIRLDPRLPSDWEGFRLSYRCGSATYHFHVRQVAEGAPALVVDGQRQQDGWMTLRDDGREHQVEAFVSQSAPQSKRA